MIPTNTRRNHITIRLGSRQIYINGFLAGFHRSHQFRQSQIGIRSHHQIDMMMLDQIVFHTFCHATQYPNNQILLLFFQWVEEFQTVQNLLLRIIADRASIHKHRIRFVQWSGHAISRHLHHRSNYFTVGHVHLATIRFNKQLFVVIGSCGFKVRSR